MNHCWCFFSCLLFCSVLLLSPCIVFIEQKVYEEVTWPAVPARVYSLYMNRVVSEYT